MQELFTGCLCFVSIAVNIDYVINRVEMKSLAFSPEAGDVNTISGSARRYNGEAICRRKGMKWKSSVII